MYNACPWASTCAAPSRRSTTSWPRSRGRDARGVSACRDRAAVRGAVRRRDRAHDPTRSRIDEAAYVVRGQAPAARTSSGAAARVRPRRLLRRHCMFEGHVIRDGSGRIASRARRARTCGYSRTSASMRAVALRAFTRGFMKTGAAPMRVACATTFYVHARWDESFHLAAMRARCCRRRGA